MQESQDICFFSPKSNMPISLEVALKDELASMEREANFLVQKVQNDYSETQMKLIKAQRHVFDLIHFGEDITSAQETLTKTSQNLHMKNPILQVYEIEEKLETKKRNCIKKNLDIFMSFMRELMDALENKRALHVTCNCLNDERSATVDSLGHGCCPAMRAFRKELEIKDYCYEYTVKISPIFSITILDSALINDRHS